MVTFINKLTGSLMYVADDRKDEYLALGHTLYAPVQPKKAPRKRTSKKED